MDNREEVFEDLMPELAGHLFPVGDSEDILECRRRGEDVIGFLAEGNELTKREVREILGAFLQETLERRISYAA